MGDGLSDFWGTKRVLVTGGNGFLGTALRAELDHRLLLGLGQQRHPRRVEQRHRHRGGGRRLRHPAELVFQLELVSRA